MDPLESAVKELGERNYGSAVRTLEMLTARDPSNADAWKHLSRAYHETGQREQAAEAAQRYAALRPTDASGHYNAGVLLAGLGQTDAALRALRAALAADPGHAKARRALAKLEGVDVETGEPVAAPPAAVPARPPEDVRRKMPWQAKVAAVLSVIAALAIIAALFLKSGRALPGAPTQNPQPSPSPITTPSPDQPTADQPNTEQTPTPNPQAQLQPNPDGSTPLPTPQDQPQLPDANQPSAQSPGSSPRGPRLFTPEEAQRVAQQIDQAHQRDVALAKGQIGQIAQAIRNLDEETWREGGRDSITLMATQLLGTNASAGALGALQMVGTAETPAQAADRLEDYARRLPPALTPQQLMAIQQVLTQPNVTPTQAYEAIKGNFDRWGIGLLDGPSRALQQALQMAPGLTGNVR
ncbi:MAG: tetratricopeptide repeat protein [Armatimonadetes bacterium]|nr:tetratricopeptide repeat protein [Armatimonadota bacterium]